MDEQLKRAHPDSIAKEVESRELELAERLHTLESESSLSSQKLLKLRQACGAFESRLALIRTERQALMRITKRYAKELRRLENPSTSHVNYGVIVAQDIPQDSVKDRTRHMKMISKLEEELGTLNERLKETSLHRESVDQFREPLLVAIGEIVRPSISHHSQIDHAEREQLVNLLLSSV